MFKKFILATAIFSISSLVFAQYPLVEEYLCDLGKAYFKKGRYKEALHEFKKVLLLNPDNQEAKSYNQKIKLLLKNPKWASIEKALREIQQTRQ